MNCTSVDDSDEEKEGEEVPAPAIIEMQGYLTKQGKVVKNWKRRWFVLRNTRLYYYKSSVARKPKGKILLKDVVLVDVSYSGNQFGFHLNTPNRPFDFYADCQRDKDSWLYALSNAIWKENKKPPDEPM